MALSNWDTLAMGLDGKPSDGKLFSKDGQHWIEIYKNWIYLMSADYEYAVGTVVHGEVEYRGIRMMACRGPQNGVYVVASVGYGEEQYGLVGAGVYGYDDHDWVGIKNDSVSFLFSPQGPFFNSEGYEMLGDDVKRDELHRAQHLRFNQGDKYFADKLDFAVPTTPPGEAEPTVMSMLVGDE